MSNPVAKTPETSTPSARMLWVFGAASLAAIALGAAVMAQDGASPSLWLRNPATWLAAAAIALTLPRASWFATAMAPLALITIALSFLGPEQEGVHRWIGVGPIQVNAAALVLPAAIAVFTRMQVWPAIACFALIAALLALQPDISQLAGFALAAVILCAARFGPGGAVLSFVLSAAALALCLTRPDSLAPVPQVEGIVFLAWSKSPALALAMTAALAATALSPLLAWRTSQRWPAFALAAYFTTTAAAFLFGAYPVPLAGYGLSFVLGWWLAAGVLASPRLHWTANPSPT